MTEHELKVLERFREIVSATTVVGFNEFMDIYGVSDQEYESARKKASQFAKLKSQGLDFDSFNENFFGYWEFWGESEFVYIKILQNGWRSRRLKVTRDLVLKTVVLGDVIPLRNPAPDEQKAETAKWPTSKNSLTK